MLKYLPVEEISSWHLAGIGASFAVAPDGQKPTLGAVLANIDKGLWKLFTFSQGFVIVSIEKYAGEKRLQVIGTFEEAGKFGFLLPTLLKELKLLASNWGCDAVESTCYSQRQAQAIVKLGGEIESYNMLLKVKG